MVYQITEEDIERSSTLEESDLGRWYILVQGCIHFVESPQSGQDLINYIED